MMDCHYGYTRFQSNCPNMADGMREEDFLALQSENFTLEDETASIEGLQMAKESELFSGDNDRIHFY
jgi:hypothetical protein